jgi:integrase
MSLESAREEAGLLNWKRSNDKLDPRVASKAGKATLAFVVDRWMHAHVSTLKPATQKGYKSYAKAITREWGNIRWRDLRLEDLLVTRATYGGTPVMFNRMMSVLKAAWNWAQLAGIVDAGLANPAALVKNWRENPRERYLDDEELSRLFKEIDTLENRVAADAIMLILLTGARRGEVENLQWEEIDWDEGVARLSDSKTGSGRVLFLSPEALSILASRRPTYGRQSGACFDLTTLRYWWDKASSRANLRGVRLHDLRHTFASQGMKKGVPIEVISKLLGHSDLRSTQRYAHLGNEQLHDAVVTINE